MQWAGETQRHGAAKPQSNRSATGPRAQRVGNQEIAGKS